jgi:hypothetical protein
MAHRPAHHVLQEPLLIHRAPYFVYLAPPEHFLQMQLHAIGVEQGRIVHYQGPRHAFNVPLENSQRFNSQHFAVTVLLEHTHQEMDLQHVLCVLQEHTV